MATRNTTHSKTKPFWKIATAARDKHLGEAPQPPRSRFTIASRPAAASPTKCPSDVCLHSCFTWLYLLFCSFARSQNLFGLSAHDHTTALRKARVPAAVVTMGSSRKNRTMEPGAAVKSRMTDRGLKLHCGAVVGGVEIGFEARGHADNNETVWRE